jgi:hypothetical protein
MHKEGNLISSKQLKIEKANTTIIIVLSVCSFLIVFSILGTKALLSQYSYQNRVTTAQGKTITTLQANRVAAEKLIKSYNTFNGQTTNIIGGSASAITSNQDGTNAKIILDALPYTYDFPALATAIQNLITVPGVTISGITGTDSGSGSSVSAAPVATPSTTTAKTPTSSTAVSSTPQPVSAIPIPFTFTVSGSYTNMTAVLTNIERSIRPINVGSIVLSGSDNDMTMVVTANTYYFPSKGLDTSTEIIK